LSLLQETQQCSPAGLAGVAPGACLCTLPRKGLTQFKPKESDECGMPSTGQNVLACARHTRATWQDEPAVHQALEKL
jgi:hypothetical protein